MPTSSARPLHADPPTAERLRRDIDSGETGEKVPYPDPAAAPLGADDEAGGAPPTALQRQMEASARPTDGVKREGFGPVGFYAAAIVAIGCVVAALVFVLG